MAGTARTRTIAAAMAVAATGAVGLVGATPAGADQVLVSCDAAPQQAKLNPPLGSGDSRYYKSVGKAAGGATCSVDSGIATESPAADSTKPNRFDDQTNGHTTLTVASSTTSTSGSFTCNTTDPANHVDYPWTYPGQGKLTTKFVETDAAGRQLKLQAYIRLGKDPADPDPFDLVVSGIVIKGVGVGGSVHAVVALSPDLTSPKNLNVLDCLANPAVGNASLSVFDIVPSDGSDPGTEVDPWTVSIPD